MDQGLIFPLAEAAQRTREFLFNERDFHRVRELIYGRAGISLKPGKQEMIYSRLARRLRALQLKSFKEYLALLEDEGSPEWEAFVNAITTNLTQFFREQHHFEILAKQLRETYTGKPLSLWSCACSTGEEAYSMAMTAAEVFDTLSPPVKILASDLDTNVLGHAQQGVYRADRLDSISPQRLKRFFLRGVAARQGEAKVKLELRQLVSFSRINLMDKDWPLSEPCQAIFCRNVMIYFDRATQREILKKIHRSLTADGRLYVGHSENLFHAKDLFELCDKTVYRPLK
jgi:chemotaxis protein methyltransferase CheR